MKLPVPLALNLQLASPRGLLPHSQQFRKELKWIQAKKTGYIGPPRRSEWPQIVMCLVAFSGDTS